MRITLTLLFHSLFCLCLVELAVNSAVLPVESPTPQTACTGFAFDLAPEYGTGYRPVGVAAADLDGDGIVDIATANGNFGVEEFGVSILRGLGQGRFAPRVDLFYSSETIRPRHVYLEDLNGDGKMEIILPDGNRYKFIVFENMSSGPGNFDFSEPITLGDTTWGRFQNMAFADFDGDGLKDILASESSNKAYLFRKIGSAGELLYASPIELAGSGGDDPTIAVGDFDGDGRMDIARPLGILRNASTGPGDISFENFNLAISDSLAAADLDGDGKPEIIGLARLPRHHTFVMRNQSTPGNLSFSSRQTFDVGNIYGAAPPDVQTADIDGDGKIDILASHPGANSVAVLRNTSSGNGSIDFAARQHDFGAGYLPSRMFLIDVNADERPDVLTANIEANTVSVLINESSIGSVDLATRRDYLTAASKGVSNVALADFDLDGNLDIAVSYKNQSQVIFSVFANDGNGRFPTRIDADPPNMGNIQFGYLIAEDLDSDGRTDLALAIVRSGFYEAFVFRNVSTGPGHVQFEQTRYLPLEGRPTSMYGADVNGDGKRDLIVVAKPFFGSERAYVYRNDAVGSNVQFQEIASVLVLGQRVAVADFNLDRKDDFAYSHSFVTDDSRHLFFTRFQLSTGNGFEAQDVQVDRAFGASLAVDADRDGRVDLLSSGQYGELEYARNQSAPGVLNFNPVVQFSTIFLSPVSTGDFDGNGTLDILIANSPLLRILSDGVNAPEEGGVLSDHIAYASSWGVESWLDVGDFNNDGSLDVVSGSSAENVGVSVLLNRPCSAQPTPTAATLSGRVVAPDGSGIRGASVWIRDTVGSVRTISTSSLGYFTFSDVGPGQIQVSVTSKRYRFVTQSVPLAGSPVNIDFVGLE